jgi:hypothetical protein
MQNIRAEKKAPREKEVRKPGRQADAQSKKNRMQNRSVTAGRP